MATEEVLKHLYLLLISVNTQNTCDETTLILSGPSEPSSLTLIPSSYPTASLSHKCHTQITFVSFKSLKNTTARSMVAQLTWQEKNEFLGSSHHQTEGYAKSVKQEECQ